MARIKLHKIKLRRKIKIEDSSLLKKLEFASDGWEKLLRSIKEDFQQTEVWFTPIKADIFSNSKKTFSIGSLIAANTVELAETEAAIQKLSLCDEFILKDDQFLASYLNAELLEGCVIDEEFFLSQQIEYLREYLKNRYFKLRQNFLKLSQKILFNTHFHVIIKRNLVKILRKAHNSFQVDDEDSNNFFFRKKLFTVIIKNHAK